MALAIVNQTAETVETAKAVSLLSHSCLTPETVSKIELAIGLQRQQIEKFKVYKAILINSAVTGKIKVC
jgi:hypothetical protein